MNSHFQNPDDEQLKALLLKSASLAIVGLSPRPNRPSYVVAKYMLDYGFTIYPVRPAVKSVLHQPAYAQLEDIPVAVDIAVVFRASDKIEEVVDSCLQSKVPVMWLQEGIVNEVAARRAMQAGMTVIMNQCIYKVYRRLCQP